MKAGPDTPDPVLGHPHTDGGPPARWSVRQDPYNPGYLGVGSPRLTCGWEVPGEERSGFLLTPFLDESVTGSRPVDPSA